MNFQAAIQFYHTLMNNIDCYNKNTGEYVFRYSEDGAIAVYHLSTSDIDNWLKENDIHTDKLYWGAYLGVGGTIYEDPMEYCIDHFKEDGWMTCEEYEKEVYNEMDEETERGML